MVEITPQHSDAPLYNPFGSVGVFIKSPRVATGGLECRGMALMLLLPFGAPLAARFNGSLDSVPDVLKNICIFLLFYSLIGQWGSVLFYFLKIFLYDFPLIESEDSWTMFL